MAKITVENGQSIQAAIDNANEGDEIIVKKGFYNERLEIGKKITLKGESGNPEDMPVIWQSFDEYEDGFCVIAITTNGIKLENLIVRENENGEADGEVEEFLSESEIGLVLVSSRCKASLSKIILADSAMPGIYISEGAKLEVSNIEIMKNDGVYLKQESELSAMGGGKFHDCKGNAISVCFGSSAGLDCCEIYNNEGAGVHADGKGSSVWMESSKIYNNDCGLKLQYGATGEFGCGCDFYKNENNIVLDIGDVDPDEEFDEGGEDVEASSFSDCKIHDAKDVGITIYGVAATFDEACYIWNNKGGDVQDEGECGRFDCEIGVPPESDDDGGDDTPPSPPSTPTKPSASNALSDMNADLKAALAKSQADLKKSLEDTMAETRKALNDSLKDAFKGL